MIFRTGVPIPTSIRNSEIPTRLIRPGPVAASSRFGCGNYLAREGLSTTSASHLSAWPETIPRTALNRYAVELYYLSFTLDCPRERSKDLSGSRTSAIWAKRGGKQISKMAWSRHHRRARGHVYQSGAGDSFNRSEGSSLRIGRELQQRCPDHRQGCSSFLSGTAVLAGWSDSIARWIVDRIMFVLDSRHQNGWG